jgi:putative transposase
LAGLSEKVWLHPVTGEPVRFGASTIERWYYAARKAADPVGVLRRKRREDSGQQHTISTALGEVVLRQYAAHPSWSYKLHLDNLAVVVQEKPHLAPLPSYASLRRYLVAHGLQRRRRQPVGPMRAGEQRALESREQREVRSYESEYVGGLWASGLPPRLAQDPDSCRRVGAAHPSDDSRRPLPPGLSRPVVCQ